MTEGLQNEAVNLAKQYAVAYRAIFGGIETRVSYGCDDMLPGLRRHLACE